MLTSLMFFFFISLGKLDLTCCLEWQRGVGIRNVMPLCIGLHHYNLATSPLTVLQIRKTIGILC